MIFLHIGRGYVHVHVCLSFHLSAKKKKSDTKETFKKFKILGKKMLKNSKCIRHLTFSKKSVKQPNFYENYITFIN